MGNDDIVKRLRNWDDGGVSTHYDGCIETHWRCAILLAADAIEARDAEIDRLRAEVERQRSIADTAWRKMDDAINERTGKHLKFLTERALADRLAIALAAQGSVSFDENTNLNIKKLALDAYKDARGIGNANTADVES